MLAIHNKTEEKKVVLTAEVEHEIFIPPFGGPATTFYNWWLRVLIHMGYSTTFGKN